MTIFRVFLVFVCLGTSMAPLSGWANRATDHANLCENAARIASTKTGVPASVLLAITLTETGRMHDGRFSAWPWTLNVSGKGFWFENASAATQFIHNQISAGNRNFDVGCFQINYYWHHNASAYPESMLDPLESAEYAAKFLMDLFKESGDWSIAAGAYHSRTPKFAKKYRKRFDRLRMAHLESDQRDVRPLSKNNNFPLFLMTSGTFVKGSLFDLSSSPHGRLIEETDARGSLLK